MVRGGFPFRRNDSILFSTAYRLPLVSDITENTVNDLLARHLASVPDGMSLLTETSARAADRGQPDFELQAPSGVVYGEGEWETSFEHGFAQAVNYGTIPGASGYFVIGYPVVLRRLVRERLGQNPAAPPRDLLSKVTFHGYFKLGDSELLPFRGEIDQVIDWLRNGLARRKTPFDETVFLRLMGGIIRNLDAYLPKAGKYEPVFRLEHLPYSERAEDWGTETARQAAAYLLLNQIVFYHILAQGQYAPMDPAAIGRPSDLKTVYFDRVFDYRAIFSIDLASQLPAEATDYVRDLVRVVNELRPERLTSDLLGNLFHRLMPENVRKKIAAFYTNPMAARLLAHLAVKSPRDKVADLACGSGTLLLAAYDAKADLLSGQVTPKVHKAYLEEDLTGCDILAFAAHLAAVQLALRNPTLLTDSVRVAVRDSLGLRPNQPVGSLQEIELGGQTRLDEYDSTGAKRKRRTVHRGSVSSDGAGRGFTLTPVDVILMNPPFSRKQGISPEHRGWLAEKFKDYSKFVSGEQNLTPYFIPLADRFLSPGGRLAMVLPTSILRQRSAEGTRRLLAEKYDIQFIIRAGFRSAFSQSASFGEVLLLGQKREHPEPGPACVLVRMGAAPSPGNLHAVTTVLEEAARPGALTPSLNDRAKRLDLTLSKLEQAEFARRSNWQEVLPDETDMSAGGLEAPVLTPLRDVVPKVIQGIRFNDTSDAVHPKNTLLSRARDAKSHVDWRIEAEDADSVTATSTATGVTVRVPKSVLRPTTRTISGMTTMEMVRDFDYVVTGRFPGDSPFWDDPDPNGILRRRLPHLRSREAMLLLAGRNQVDLSAPGTSHLAVVTSEPVPPTWSFWCVQVRSYDEARYLALWWNSTYNLRQLMARRAETRGTVVSWILRDLLPMPVMNPAKLTVSNRETLDEVWEKWARTPFPSLLDQLAQRFEGRLEIDRAIASLLGDSNETDLEVLYETLASRLTELRGLMSND
jgi:N-6 DNA Methylase